MDSWTFLEPLEPSRTPKKNEKSNKNPDPLKKRLGVSLTCLDVWPERW